MANRSNHPMYHNGGTNDDLESGATNYQAMSTQQLERQREQDLARQDALLDQIHGGVKGLKNHALVINGEVVEQNVMIDDIGNVRLALFFACVGWYAVWVNPWAIMELN